MADVTLTYKGQTILEMSATGIKALKTAGKYCEDDIEVDFVKPGGIYFGGNRPPESSLGVNGEYYYQRDKSLRAIKSFSDVVSGSTSIAFGIEFTVSQNTTVTHLCGRTTENRTGKLQIGTTSEILAEIENVSFPAGEWVEKELDSPIQLVPDVHYVVRAVVDSAFSTGALAYARSAAYVTYSEVVTNVQGRYSNNASVWPGDTDQNSGCLVCIKYLNSNDLYRINSQFYKSSGAWSEIT